jgi:hypothetical protein
VGLTGNLRHRSVGARRRGSLILSMMNVLIVPLKKLLKKLQTTKNTHRIKLGTADGGPRDLRYNFLQKYVLMRR